jgi:hypothetical protein
MSFSLRISLPAVAIGALVVVSGACAKTDDAVSTGAPSVSIASSSKTDKPTTTEAIDPKGTTPGGDTPTTSKKTIGQGKVTTTTAATPTTTGGKVTGPAFAAAAVQAFRAQLGEFKALELVIHVDNANAEVQAQDPAKPANVDSYEYRGSAVDGPTPVKLTGDGDLESNLFAVGEVAWDKVPAMMDQAVASMGTLDGSTGVTHLIIKKNLPFDDDTVVNVYVDGGSRSNGGYVSFKADGTLKKAYPPS